jgi:hypothetical protein
MAMTRTATRAALAAAVAIATVALGYSMHRAPAHHAAEPAAPAVIAAPASASPPAPVKRPPVTSPPVKRSVPHDRVAPAPPTAFEIKGTGLDVKAQVCQMDYVRPLDPPGDQRHTVCWVREKFGVAPGTTSGGTSYILGHAWSHAPLVFNPMSELAMKEVDREHPGHSGSVAIYPVKRLNGDRITLRTANGVLTYVVRSAFAVSKEQAADVQSLMANTPDRVVLITCGVAGGADVDLNIVVYAYLVSSLASGHAAGAP